MIKNLVEGIRLWTQRCIMQKKQLVILLIG